MFTPSVLTDLTVEGRFFSSYTFYVKTMLRRSNNQNNALDALSHFINRVRAERLVPNGWHYYSHISSNVKVVEVCCPGCKEYLSDVTKLAVGKFVLVSRTFISCH